jgi:hypothetical protein
METKSNPDHSAPECDVQLTQTIILAFHVDLEHSTIRISFLRDEALLVLKRPSAMQVR